ncbi:uncharacterized protein CANTADRAFT_88315 [Suhomyces tanzawaensis NRRL Y-17324]|uniref:DNA-binding protein RAP1 n=1 Tax=Suhomyces tanzawaensis NRRL Y-17324 TaxID=984487 RepID=A0A1E4SSE3_9ASCO|nr:uncharacterized protein CANTADRAFT_88315 [Suhomyces tanzawaensis NRRL Y-17324]ODV82421.1 hypothetical protein CANTADRAFT_88315 [Suhomyces tanzawaensis NRRL Y-17324]
MSFQGVSYDATLEGTNDIDASVAIQGVPGVATRPQIFTLPDDLILFFIIPQNEPDRHRYIDQIISNGGSILGVESDMGSKSSNHEMFISSRPFPGKTVYSIKYIDDCLATGHLLDPKDYLFNGSDDQEEDVKPVKPSRGHSKFTPEKDQYILRRIRMQPKYRDSHSFFDQLATEDMLKDHTGNSIRSRYRKHLKQHLLYVYQVDESGRPIRDDRGKKIKLGLDELPDTIKNKYTAEEDYIMCIEAKKFLLFENKRLDEAHKLPYSFFNDVHRKAPKHSLHSWRDHYRKYVTAGTIPEFIEYYEQSISRGIRPKPLSIVRDNQKGNETIRDLVGSRYRKVPIDVYGESALDEEIGETKSSNIDEALRSSERSRVSPIPAPTLARIVGNDNENLDDSLSGSVFLNEQKGLGEPSEDEDNYSTANEDEETALGRLPQILEQYGESLQGDRKRQKTLEYHEVERFPSAQVESQTQYKTPHASQVDSFNINEIPSISTIDGIEPLIKVGYLESTFRFSDILFTNGYAFLENWEDTVAQLRPIIKRAASQKELFQVFVEYGFKQQFTSHLVMSTSANRNLMVIYLEELLSRISDYVNSDKWNNQDLSVVEHHRENFLTQSDLPGIWDIHLDAYLNTNEEEKLLEVQNKKLIQQRKLFLTELIDNAYDVQFS